MARVVGVCRDACAHRYERPANEKGLTQRSSSRLCLFLCGGAMPFIAEICVLICCVNNDRKDLMPIKIT